MDGAITIRAGTLDDIPVILHHRRAMFEDMGRGTPGTLDESIELFRPTLERWLQDGTYRGFLAATASGEVVGGGGLIVHEWPAGPLGSRPSEQRAYILNVYTEPAYRRRGIARQIMEAIIECCRREGRCLVFLHASDQGRPIYEAMGFKPTNEMRLKL